LGEIKEYLVDHSLGDYWSEHSTVGRVLATRVRVGPWVDDDLAPLNNSPIRLIALVVIKPLWILVVGGGGILEWSFSKLNESFCV